MKKNVLLIGIMILFLFVSSAPLSQGLKNKEFSLITLNGKTLYVGGSGPGNYTTIQDAIDDADNGDNIFVYSSIYHEDILINKSIDLIGEDKENTIIDGCGQWYVVHIVADNVTVKNFYITNSTIYGTNSGIKIYGERENITVYNNIIIDNFFGICIGDSYQYKRIYNVNITNNYIVNNTYGIGLIEGQESIIFNNTFINNGIFILSTAPKENIVKDNTINGKPIVYLEDKSNKIVQSNVGQIILVNCEDITISFQILNIKSEVGIQLIRCTNCNVINNQLSNKLYGIYSICSDYTNIQGNQIENVTIGIQLDSSDYNSISFNSINDSRNSIDIGESIDITISENILTNGRIGIDFWHADGNKIIRNKINHFLDYGIQLYFACNRNQILNNSVQNCSDAGIYIYGPGRIWWDLACVLNVISGNEIKNNNLGVFLDEPSLTKVSFNNISKNDIGVEVRSARYNIIFKNDIFENKDEDAILKNSFLSKFDRNFWNETKRIHIIKGGFYRYDFWGEIYYEVFPIIRFDWHAVKVPYNIAG